MSPPSHSLYSALRLCKVGKSPRRSFEGTCISHYVTNFKMCFGRKNSPGERDASRFVYKRPIFHHFAPLLELFKN